jgi:hypothetical protein
MFLGVIPRISGNRDGPGDPRMRKIAMAPLPPRLTKPFFSKSAINSRTFLGALQSHCTGIADQPTVRSAWYTRRLMAAEKLYQADYLGSGTFIISKPKRKKHKLRQSRVKSPQRGARK